MMRTLDPSAVEAILSGFTHYIVTRSGLTTTLYFRPDGRLFATLADDEQRSGVWATGAAGFSVQWADRERAQWRLASAPGQLVYVNADGKAIGTVSKIVAGNAEQFGEPQ